jgi:hypothetical protein
MYSQNNPIWKDTKFKDCAKSTIGQNGCLLASLCNSRKKFYPNEDYNPLQAIKDWSFVVGADGEKHWLLWSTDFPGFSLVARVRQFDMAKAKAYMKEPDLAVCIEVETKSGGRHWLMASKASILGGIKCLDPYPYPANVPAQTWGFLGRYKRPTGYAVVRKKP